MAFAKVITVVNWILIAVYGYYVIWALFQATKPSHEMPGVETIIKVTGLVLLLSLIAMNMSNYQWLKVSALVLAVVLLLIIKSFSD
ncbi:hypothetical protein [Dyadobacter sp. CY326]|uniref:hypothetical protein n=1 Tax=Dyadobacter sp. CY326 TaxID=2907300 RepID=UPI001F47F975|nr:hypothetical protein [Dyadobacter sp. CY326]MCE7066643.1 hypothetical protein [Dyadobacter sp. CY326]